jgi:hypothetical protein
VIILFLIAGGVAAKESIKHYFLTQTNENNTISEVLSVTGQVNANVNSNLQCSDDLTISDIEKELEVNFLISSSNKLDACNIRRNSNNEIESVFFDIRNVKIGNLDVSSVSISFMTQSASDETINAYKRAAGIERTVSNEEDAENLVESRYSEKLGTDIYLINDTGTDFLPYRTPFFVYKDILYYLFPDTAGADEIIEALESLV